MTTPEPVDLADFPIRERQVRYEDFALDDVIEHHWGRTITAADNTVFSAAMCTWSPMYLNAEFAARHGHAEPVVNPMLVLCITVGLSVEQLSEGGGPFLGIDECAFERCVHVGDTITSRSVVVDTRISRSRADHGIVTWRTEGVNQRGEVVLHLLRTNLLARRSPEDAS